MSTVLKCLRDDLNWLSASLYIPSLSGREGVRGERGGREGEERGEGGGEEGGRRVSGRVKQVLYYVYL